MILWFYDSLLTPMTKLPGLTMVFLWLTARRPLSLIRKTKDEKQEWSCRSHPRCVCCSAVLYVNTERGSLMEKQSRRSSAVCLEGKEMDYSKHSSNPCSCYRLLLKGKCLQTVSLLSVTVRQKVGQILQSKMPNVSLQTCTVPLKLNPSWCQTAYTPINLGHSLKWF